MLGPYKFKMITIMHYWTMKRYQACIKIQRAFRSCHKELFYLRKHQQYIKKFVVGHEITCAIGFETIKKPVLWNGHLYEKKNLAEWCKIEKKCPFTRKKNRPIIDYLKLSQFIEQQWALKEMLKKKIKKLKKTNAMQNL